jgi:tetrapyrrole methylase family protein/MazG family protein
MFGTKERSMVQGKADRITIVGLGPGAFQDLTLGAWQTLREATQILLRTERHPVTGLLTESGEVRAELASCDDLYAKHAEFAQVYAAIVERVFEMAGRVGDVVYAVPGHPLVGEATTRMILERARSEGVEVRIVGGQSFLEPIFAALGVDAMDGAQVADAMLLARQHHPKVEVGLPLLVAQVYARWLASDLKLTLMNAYPPQQRVMVVQAAGTAEQRITEMALHELDAEERFNHLTSLYVPAMAEGRSFSDLQEIVGHLRAPEGCPWDREQTLASLRRDLLSEASEVLEAIDLEETGVDNSRHIVEELGDLMLVATMMVQIATEEGRFQMGDVTQEVVAKLIRRHPHVFGDVAVDGVDHVLANWDAIKAQEKVERGQEAAHALDGIPAALPALEKARQLQSKAAKAGMLNLGEAAHANSALAQALSENPDEGEIGAALWQLVALAKQNGLDAEDALRAFAVAFRQAH